MDLIELIPVILIALYYIFRPGKKKQEEEEYPHRRHQDYDSEEPERRHRTLEDILREALEGEKQHEPVPAPKSKPLITPKEEFVIGDEVENDLYKAYTGVWEESEKVREKPGRFESSIPAVISADEKIYIDEFDLRQAVINDAILNRPWA